MAEGIVSDYAREFGKHVRALRRNRGMTQEVLAKRSGLSADTIRRVEHGSFTASMDTLRKLGMGLGLSMTTLFETFELGCTDERRELVDLVAACKAGELRLVLRVVRALLDELGLLANAGGADDD